MLSQVMKIWFIILSPSESLAIKSRPLNKADAQYCQTVSEFKKVSYAIFFSGEGVAIKVLMEKGKKHHR